MNNRNNQSFLVDLPVEKGIKVKKAGEKKEEYVYKVIQYFRNQDHKPRTKSIMIGKYDPPTGKMSPNKNYYAYYGISPLAQSGRSLSFGLVFALTEAAVDLKLYGILSPIFGDKAASEILVASIYTLQCGNVMDGIDDWCEKHETALDGPLTSQSTSELFARIREPMRRSFFEAWIDASFTRGSVCYDVTSVSSYSDHLPMVERGYNRDHDDLAQFNLGLFCDEATRMPLYYNRYSGSLTDRTNLKYVLAEASSFGIDKVKLIMDGGFWGAEALRTLQGYAAFTIGMPCHFKEARQVIQDHSQGVESYEFKTDFPFTFCREIKKTIHNVPGKVMLFYNSEHHANLTQEMHEYVDRLNIEISQLVRYPKSKLKRYEKYFKVTKHADGPGFDYEIDARKVDEQASGKGFFLIFTNDMESTPDETLYFYRAKDMDEKIFAQIKNYMDGNRIRTHTEETTEGKTFVVFLATILRTYLYAKLSPYMKEHSTSLKKALTELSNITTIRKQEKLYLTKALTKKQKQLIKLLNLEKRLLEKIDSNI